jgi:hypothetical protein
VRGHSARVASRPGVDTPLVFVQHSVHINRPIESVSAALAAGPSKWLPRFDGTDHADIGPEIAGLGIRKKVAVEVGQSLAAGDWIQVPVKWQATFVKRLFPVMAGRVELSPVGPHTTRLSVGGMYQPPLGGLGKELDDAFLHKVAEATVKELAESIGKRLEAIAAEAVTEPA